MHKAWVKFQKLVSNVYHNLLMLSLDISDITTITVKGIHYRCIISGISKSDAIDFLKISVFDDGGFT